MNSKKLSEIGEKQIFLGESLSTAQKRVIEESLSSIVTPYRYFVDEFIEKLLIEKLISLGLKREDFEIVRSINLTEEECITYGRSRFYQWYLKFNFKEKFHRVKLLEVPYINSLGIAILNGLKKVFVLKLKRRNVVFYKDGENRCVFLTSLRNKRYTLKLSPTKERSIFFKGLKVNAENQSGEEFSCVLLSKDSLMLNKLCDKKDFFSMKDVFSKPYLDELFNLLNKQPDCVFEGLHPVNRSWVTSGGYIRELIERAFFDEKVSSNPLSFENHKDLIEYVFKKLNLKDLNSRISQYCNDGSFVQLLDNLNPVSEIIHARKISLLYKGLLTRTSAIMELRDLNMYQQGRICTISTAEGQTIGLIRHLALGAKFDKNEELLVPYFKIKSGKLSNEVYWANIYEEIDKYITDFKSYFSSESIVKARKNDKLFFRSKSELDFVMFFPKQTLSLGISMLNQNDNSEPDRLLMAGNMFRQSLCLKYPEAPIVRSQISDLCLNWYLRRMDFKDSQSYLSSKHSIELSEDNKVTEVTKVIPFSKTNANTINLPKIQSNQKYSRMVPFNSNEDLTWAFGKNIRVGYLSWEGYNFEDSLIISDSLIRSEAFTSLHVKELKIPIFKIDGNKEKITRNIINAFKYNLNNLDENGVIKVGSKVFAGDILVTKIKPVRKKLDSPEQRLLLSILGERNLSYRNDFFYLPSDIKNATILSVDYQRGRLSKKEFTPWIESKLEKLKLERNKLILSLAKNRFSYSNSQLKNLESDLEKELIPSSFKEVKNSYEQSLESLNESMSKQDCLFSIKISLLIEKPFKVGDKLTGSHGNKGVISKIVPDYEMPFDEEGRHLELLISNLSVYGRLNLSQMVESYLGSLHISCMDWLEKKSFSQEALDQLASLSGVNKTKLRKIKNLEDAKKINFLDFAYDPQSEKSWDKIKSLAKLTNLVEMRKLRCGLTGEEYENTVHVGKIHIFKLSHTVDSKYSARSIGSHSIKFNQPTRGKMVDSPNSLISSGMAQKIGTMEKDALVSRGLWVLLQEMFTLRSDSVAMRRKVLSGEIFQDDFLKDWNLLESTRSVLHMLKSMFIDLKIIKDYDTRLPIKCKFQILKQDDILAFSKGEVKEAETIHYRTKVGIENGLFCPKIFGSDKDSACECSKYVGSRYLGLVCSSCGVLVATNRARRNFFGHIKMVKPLVNIKLINEPIIKFFLPILKSQINKIISHKAYLKVERNNSFSFVEEWSLSPDYRLLSGGEAIEFLIDRVNPLELYQKEEVSYLRGKSKLDREFLDGIRDFLLSGNKLSDIIVRYVPVMPKHLRPLMFTGTGSFISTHINTELLQLIRSNNRLKEIVNFKLLPFVIENAYAQCQEKLNELCFDDKETISIAGNFKGKAGIIRQNVLSKRINFSGRSVLILNPNLPSGYCGIPKSMLKKTFLPLIQKEMVDKLIAEDYYDAFDKIKNDYPLDDIIFSLCKRNPILINRNPTLHSLSMQAFFPIPVDHDAIEIHPLALKALGGDIDGDAVNHYSAQTDRAREELLKKVWEKSSINPSNYDLIIKPSREIALGLWYLTESEDEGDSILLDQNNILREFENNLPSRKAEYFGIKTTVGRARLIHLFSLYLGWDYLNSSSLTDVLNSRWSKSKIDEICEFIDPLHLNEYRIPELIDELKKLGNRASSKSGYSFSVEELLPLRNKIYKQDLNECISSIKLIQDQYYQGFLGSYEDFQSSVLSKWDEFEHKSIEILHKNLKNTVTEKIIDSKHRGSWENIRSIVLSRGIITFKEGEWLPVTQSLLIGLNEMDFALMSKVIKKLIDKALGTAKGGYFNRKLVETLREVRITETDCGSKEGIILESKRKQDFFGRFDLEGKVLENIYDGRIRSPLTCISKGGICQKCFGWEPGKNSFPVIGKSIGSLSAYALAEPVTQMMMKTKHMRFLTISSDDYESLKLDSDERIILQKISESDFKILDSGKKQYLGFLPLKIMSDKSSFLSWLNHGEIIDESVSREGEIFKWSPLNDQIYSPCSGQIKLKDSLLTVVGDIEFTCRTSEYTKLYVKEGDLIQKGDILLSVRKSTNEEILGTSFESLNSLFSKRDKTKFDLNFNVFAKEDSILHYSPETKKYVLLGSKSRLNFQLPEKLIHRLLYKSGVFKKGELVFRGLRGYHPFDLIESREIDIAVQFYMGEINKIYSNEKINLLKVHLELLVRELTLLGKDKFGEVNSIRYFNHHGISNSSIQKFINDPYHGLPLNSPLSIIGYEDIIRNLMKVSVLGVTDSLNTINGNIVVGCPIPIEENYNADLSTNNKRS